MALDGEIENVLERISDRLAALERQTKSHERVCGPRGWASVILTAFGIIFMFVLSSYVSRITGEQDAQNRSLAVGDRERSNMAIEIGGMKNDIETLFKLALENAKGIRALENRAVAADARRAMREEKAKGGR